MTEAVKIVRVFLASPGDLVDERQVAREVVEEINDAVRSLRVQLELLGWEDTRPGAGRPQSIINRDVDCCDLFVGLMWRHWGTPTGTHSSGFEEEFTRAQVRRSDQGAPDIWLSFKAIAPEHLEDPGPQLRRVLEFREQQIERREVLFKEFADTTEWRTLLRRWLLSYVIELSYSNKPGAQVISSPPPNDDRPPDQAVAPSEGDTVSSQQNELADFVRALDPDALHISWPDRRPTLVIAHLQVTASATMATFYPDVKLGIHEANLLYSVRTELQLAAFERFHAVRSVIADRHQRVPGWYWFQSTNLELLFSFVNDRDQSVAVGALALLGNAGVTPSSNYADSVLRSRLASGSAALFDAIGDYLALAADPSYIESLEATDIGGSLSEIALAAKLRDGSDCALDELEHHVALSARLDAAVKAFPKSAAVSSLHKALNSRHEPLRVGACDALVKAGSLSDSQAFALIRDDSAKVRAAAFSVLIASGAEVDLEGVKKTTAKLASEGARAILVAYYRRIPFELLVSKLDYVGTNGREIYEALGLEFPDDFLDRIRRDLSTEMADFFGEWLKALRLRHSEPFATDIEALWTEKPDVLEFVKNAYIAAGLRVVAVRGKRGDAEFGRRYLSNEDRGIVAGAVAVLSRFGRAGDAANLVDVAQKSYGDLAALAATAALKLSRSVEKVILPLLKSGKPPLIRPALRRLPENSQEKTIAILTELLVAEKESSRILAAEMLVEVDRARAELILDEYQRGYRYYDAVCWLDRLLFAPEALRIHFQRKLAELS